MERETFNSKELTKDWEKIIFDEAISELRRGHGEDLVVSIISSGLKHGFKLKYKDICEILNPYEELSIRNYED